MQQQNYFWHKAQIWIARLGYFFLWNHPIKLYIHPCVQSHVFGKVEHVPRHLQDRHDAEQTSHCGKGVDFGLVDQLAQF